MRQLLVLTLSICFMIEPLAALIAPAPVNIPVSAASTGHPPISLSPSSVSLKTFPITSSSGRPIVAALKATYSVPIEVDSEVRIPELAALFSDSHFWLVRLGKRSIAYDLVVEREGAIYKMPGDFNHLLVDSNIQVTTDNQLTIARAFVLVTQHGTVIAPVIFSDEAEVTERDIDHSDMIFQVKLKAWTQVEELQKQWRFAFTNRQIALATSENADTDAVDHALGQRTSVEQVGEVARYYLKQYSPTPRGAQPAASVGQAPMVTLNKQQVIVARNDVPSNDGVIISVAGYEPDVQITLTVDALQHERYQQVILRTDEQGQASYLWSPAAEAPTGTAFVVANGPSKNRNTWAYQSQPLQVVKEREFYLDSANTYPAVIYYSDDEGFYPKDPIDKHQVTSEEFLDIIIEAAHESYYTQVEQWDFDPPADDDHKFEIALNNGGQPFGHEDCMEEAGWNVPVPEKALICFSTASWEASSRVYNYSSYQIFVKATFAHEFFHTIQNTYFSKGPGYAGLDYWSWFIEGQARFIESVQYEAENFIAGDRRFTEGTNIHLTEELNTSLITVRTIKKEPAYDYAIFWRFLYEQYGNRDMHFLKPILINVQGGGTTASFTDGAQAIATALGHPIQDILAHFAAANYALRFQPRLESQFGGKYTYYDPNNIYVSPQTISRKCQNGSLLQDESILPSFGVDYLEIDIRDDCRVVELTFISNDGFDVQYWLLQKNDQGLIFPIDDTGPQHLQSDQNAYTPVDIRIEPPANLLAVIITRLDPPNAMGREAGGGYTVSVESPPAVEQACSNKDPRQAANCALDLIRQVLSNHNLPADPPVPNMLFSKSLHDVSSYSLTQLDLPSSTHNGNVISASLAVSHTVLSGTFSAEWNTNSWIGAQFTSLSAPQAQVYDDNNALLASGAVQARPASSPAAAGGVGGGPAVALALGDSLTYDIQGSGSASFYAPATNGLGVGGNWVTYTAHTQSTGQYGIGLRDAIVTVTSPLPTGGTTEGVYSGTLVLVTSDLVTLSGSGRTLTPNFADRVVIQAQDTKLLVGPSIGASTANVGSTPLDTAHGFALSGYTGPITITEETVDTDRIELNGPVARDLTLAVDPTNSQVIVGQPTAFTAHINSNTAGLYVVAVEPFEDWQMAVDTQGVISVTPSLGTPPGDYVVRVGVAAADDFTLFATAVHTVTVLPHQGMELNVNPDVLTTVPWGPTPPVSAGGDGGGAGVNDGRAQISGVAFTVDITNTSSAAHTFALDVTPTTFPSNWIIFGTRRATTATLTLPAGSVGQLGLYFQPPCDESFTSCDLPPAGSIHPFTVNAVAIDNGSLSANDADQFTVPALAFSYLTAEPTRLYSSPSLTTTFDLGLRNVGNTTGAFSLTLTLPITTWSATLPTSQATLAGGEVLTQTITLNTLTGDLGKDYRVSASAPSGPYAPTASVIVHLSSPEVRDIYQAAQDVDNLCVENVSLQAALHYLGQSLEEMQAACQYSTELVGSGQATCSTDLRDRVVSGALAVVNHSPTSPLVTANATLHSIAQELKTQTNWNAVQATIGDLRTAVNDLRTQIVTASSYNARAWFDPGMRAVLNDRPTAFNFNLTNAGCAPATYGITLTTSSEAVPLEPASLEWNLQPGQTLSAPIVVTPTALGAYLLQANFLMHEAPQLPLLHAEASVAVVDSLLELTNVKAQPAFIEYGSGIASALSAQIFNVANIPIDARARVRVLNSIGTEVQTTVVPVQIGSTLLPLDYALGAIDTSSFVTDTYTIAVDIIDKNDAVIPKGSAQGTFNVGQAVHASSSVSPAIVAPGTVTVTTVITTELDSAIIQSLAQRLLRVPGLAALAKFMPLEQLPSESSVVAPLAQTSEPLGVTLYTELSYNGDAKSFTADDPDLSDDLIGMDPINSIVVSDSTQAIIFSQPNYQGYWRAITASVPAFTSLGLDGINSLRILPHPTGPISITDEFDSETLDPTWNWTSVWNSGATYSTTEQPGSFRLTLPEGDHPGLESVAYLQRYDMGRGDFTMETVVSLSQATAPYKAGLALGLSDSERIFFGLRPNQLELSREGRVADFSFPAVTYTDSVAFLQVRKQGQALTFAYRAMETDEWQTLTTWYVSDPIEFVGLFGRTDWGGQLFQADFATFHLESDDLPTVVPPDPAPDVHDEFSSNTLRRPWAVSPLEGDAQYSLTDELGTLRFTLPAGDSGSTVEVQRSDIADDWAIQTRLHLDNAEMCANSGDCYRSGLVVGFSPADRFTFGFTQNRQLRMERIDDCWSVTNYALTSVDLRIEKTGDRYLFKYRAQAGDPWKILATRYVAQPVQWVGLIGRAWESRTAPLILDYAYFDLTGARVLGNGLKGEYFAGETLSDPPLVTRIDPQVNFNWGTGGPVTGMGTDYFSARWMGYIEAPTSAVYEFATIADDGTRLWVAGQELIGGAHWTIHGAGPVFGTSALTLTAGQRYSVTLEYFEHESDASAELWWRTDAFGWQLIPTEHLYPVDGVWSLAVEPVTLPADGVSPATMTVKLYDASDQPLADQLVEVQISGSHNRLNDQPITPTEWSEIGYSDSKGGVTATLTSLTAEPKVVRARVQGILLAPEVITFTTTEPVGLQILLPGEEVEQSNVNGKTGTPLAQKAGAPFDVLIRAVDAQWNTASNITDTVIITSTDPQADLSASLELVNGVATATVTLNTLGAQTFGALAPDQSTWPVAESSSLLVQRPGIGLIGEYFDDTTFSSNPVLMRLDPQIDFTWHGIAPAPELDPEYFAVRWTGQLEAPASGEYTFYTSADDGVRVQLGDTVIIDAWEPPFTPYETSSISVPLIAGQRYTVTVEYVNSEGDADAHLEWSSSSIPRQIILSRYFYPAVGFWTADVSPQAVAVSDIITASVQLLDNAEQPLEGVPVSLWGSGADLWVNGQPLQVNQWTSIEDSADDGISAAAITSTVAGTSTIRVRAHNLVLAEPRVTFTAFPAVGLQILLPGEIAAPGTPEGKAGWVQPQLAGETFEIRVRAIDAYFNTAFATGVITLTSSDVQLDGPLTATLDQGVATFSVVLKTAGTQHFNIEHAELGQAESDEVHVQTAPAISLTLEASETAQLLVPIPLTVTAFDAYGNAAYNQIQYASSDPQATLPWGESPTIIFYNGGVQTVTARIGTDLIQTVTITLSHDVTVTGDAFLPSGIYTFSNILVTANGRLALGGWCGISGVTLYADNVTIEQGGYVAADQQGACEQTWAGAGHEGSGAGHGGQGGARAGVPGGAPYGSVQQPTTVGVFGGALEGAAGGGGGGALHLIVSGTVKIDGRVSSDGGDGESNQALNGGGGSGGSLWIETQVFTGTGIVRANGGRGNVGPGLPGGGGAGGRIAIDVDADHFTGNFQVNGGSGAEAGQTGTIYLGVDPESSHITVPASQPTSLIGEVITVTLVTTTGTPVVNEPVSLKLLAGQPLTLSAGTVLSSAVTYLGTTNEAGVVTATLASTRPGTSEIEAWVGQTARQRRLLTSAAVVIVVGPIEPAVSTFTAFTDSAPNDGLTPITLTAHLVDAYLNPIAQQVVTFTVSDPRITLTPSTSSSDANGYASSTVVGTTQQPFTVTARVGEIELNQQLPLRFIGPDLVVTAQGPTTGLVGQNITYTLHVKNEGGAVAPGVVITSELPDHLTLLFADGVYTLTEGGRSLVWEAGDLSAHQAVTFLMVSATDPAAPLDGQLVTHFQATTPAEELNLLNNSTSISTRVLPAYRFTTSIIPAQQTTSLGAMTTYPIVVKNTGNLPDRFTVSIAGLSAAWYTVNPSELALRPGESAQFTVQVVVTDCAASGVYPITATVTSAGSTQAQALNAQLTLVSNPLQFNLLPHAGTTSGSTSVLFNWQTPVNSTAAIRLWRTGAVSDVQTYTATAGLQHSVNVSGLDRLVTYQWYAHAESTCGLADSPAQTFSIGNGVVFTRRGYAYTIQRDYDQRFDIAVANEDSISHTVVLTMTAPNSGAAPDSGDLIVGFTGSGSTDQVLVLEPGETRSATLVLHAQDAQAHDYTLTAQLTADNGSATPIVDTVPVQVHVTYPELNITFEEIDRDPETLVRTYRVTNHGAALTDLALSVEVISGTGTLYLTPGMTHGYLNTGQRFEFEAYPAIDADFTGLNAQLVATAAGISQTLPVTVTLPEGRSLFLGEANNVSLEVSNRDWYCTNRPIIDNFLQLPNGFRRADMDSAQLRLSLRSQSDVRPHNLAVAVNDQAIGGFQNLIPNGVYTYSVEADYLSEAAYGPTTNDVRFTTTHLNGGHYIVASDVSLGVCLNRYQEWVVADSQAAADTAVESRSFIVPAPQTLDVEILSPLAGTRLLAGMPVPIIARVDDDINRSWSYIVVVQASNDNGSLMLYDDGYHGDGAPRDGVYGGTWWPTQPGTIELTAQAGSCSLTGSARLTVTVRNPLFTAQVDHQIPVSNVLVLTDTYVPEPVGTIFNDQRVQLSWQHALTPADHTRTAMFQAVLPDMRAGEVREVATGTIVNYAGEGGTSQIHLGSLSVVAPHLVALTPLSQTIGAGMSGVYQVELYNPAETPETFTLLVTGLPASWLSTLPAVTLPAQARTSLPLTITVPTDEVVGVRTFAVVVQTDHGGQDQAAAQLNVAPLLAVQVEPPLNSGTNGQVVTYTATLTNFLDVAQHYTLGSVGLEGNRVSLPTGVDAPPQTAITVPFSITIYADRGPHPFAVTANVAGTSAAGRGEAVLLITGDRQVATRLTPQSAEGGPLVPTLYHLIVTNTGSLSDTYQFNVALPEGWTYALLANGSPIDRLSLTPYVFNETELWLIVTPAAGTPPGNYDLVVTTQSLNDPNVHSLANAALSVTGHGVQVEIVPEHTTLNPADIGTWQVLITNTGSLPDSYNLMAGGIVSASAQFVPASVSLAPGESQAVQLTSHDLDFALPQTYPFAVTARSASQPAVHNFDTADVTFNGYQAVQVELLPAAQTITDSLQASYLMVITNTGNVDTVYRLSASNPALSLQFEVDEVYIPAHMTAGVLLTARASQGGLYFITGSATSLSGSAQDSTSALLLIVLTNQPPIVEAGTDRTANEGDGVLFNGSFTDPDVGDTHIIHWNFGDGATASGTLTPTHVYADNPGASGSGTYTVTLTITDNAGGVGLDTLRVTVNNVAPVVNAGPDQTATEGESVAFTGTFTDAGTVDTHSLAWDFGDGSTAAGVLTPTHVYADNGVYTATLTVTDKDGGSGTDMVQIVVSNVSPSVEAGPDRVTSEGAVLQFTGTFTDPGTVDTHLIEWDFGDGGAATGSLTPTHTYTQSGIYTVTLSVIDDDGGMGSDSLAVTVQPGVTSCTTVTIQGEGVTDAYIWSAYPATNYDYDQLYVGTVSGGDKQALIRFDLSSLPMSTTVERATLSVNQFASSNSSPIEAHRILSDWVASAVTWNSFGNAYDPNSLGSWLPEASGWYSLEVTGLVQAWVDGTWPNDGLLLAQPLGDGPTQYHATEYAAASERPRLTLCYESGPALPVADFSATPVNGTAPLTVTFVNQSTPIGAITAYLWDFGDGTSTSSEQAPAHVYTETGTYTVTLQITADGQNYQKTRPSYISVSAPITPTTPPYSLWDDTVTPAIAAVDDADSVEVGVRFQTQADGYITGLRFYKGATNTGSHLGHLWTGNGTLLASATFTDETASGWQTVMFPYPVAVISGTVYVASYRAPNGHFAVTRNYFATPYVQSPLHAFGSGEISGGNGVYVYPSGFPNQSFLDTNYWVDVVFDTTPPVIGPTPYTLWDDTDTPATAAVGDTDSVELGVRFQPQVDGYITGLRFYKGETNTGTHVGSLWTISGTLLASATFTNETTSGWQTVTFSQPVVVVSNTVYVASYHAPNGHFALTSNYFAGPYVRPPLRTFSISEITGGNGVYAYPSGFPDQGSLSGSNYWVDVVFQIVLPSASANTMFAAVPSGGGATQTLISGEPTLLRFASLTFPAATGKRHQPADAVLNNWLETWIMEVRR